MPRLDPKIHKEYIDFMSFIAEKSKNVETPLNITQMFIEFIEFSGSPRSIRSFQKRYYKYRSKIHELENFDIETKVRILVATSTPVDSNFLNELEKQATVDVDGENRITSYIANDGKLTLKGDHGRSSKYKMFYAEKRKSQTHQQLLSNDVNGDIDDEDEDEDAEGEYVEDKVKITIRRSGRVSKKRFANSDFSNDKDHDEHKSSPKKKSKKFIDSTPTTSSANNPSSSVKMTSRIQRTKPSNDVIYDGPGEPSLPVPLMIKPEAIQYPIYPEYRVENKPIPFDLYNNQLQLEHREHPVYDYLEFDNSQMSYNNQHNEEINVEDEDHEVVSDTHFVPLIESTSSDEFLKFLQNLVTTLDSDLLHDLEKDIQEAMTTMRNENRKVLSKDIEMSLRTALTTIIKAAKPKGVSTENTTSMKGILMILNMFALNNSALTGVQQEIRKAMKQRGDDKTVSIKHIRIVLENILLLAT